MNDSSYRPIPIYELGKPTFYVIHVSAVVSCIVSLCFTVGVLVYFFTSDKEKRPWRRPVGERLVFYLAVCDFGFSINHGSDHAYLLFAQSYPPGAVCAMLAFILLMFMCVQALIVNMTAISALLMLVLERKVRFGRYDWRLWAYAYGPPCVIGGINVYFGYLGPGGAWCMVDMAREYSYIVLFVYLTLFVTVFTVNSVSYILVGIKLKRVSQAVNRYSCEGPQRPPQNKVERSVRIMALFVLIYILQWWPYFIYAVWGLVDRDSIPVWLIIGGTLCCNCGGLFNGVVYTIITKRYKSVRKDAKGTNKNTYGDKSADVSVNDSEYTTNTISTVSNGDISKEKKAEEL